LGEEGWGVCEGRSQEQGRTTSEEGGGFSKEREERERRLKAGGTPFARDGKHGPRRKEFRKMGAAGRRKGSVRRWMKKKN